MSKKSINFHLPLALYFQFFIFHCRSSGATKSKDKTLSSLERYQQVNFFMLVLTNIISSLQFFTEEKTSSLLSPKGSRLLGHAEDLNTEANAALQTLLLVSAM